jgi:hypothetical protein
MDQNETQTLDTTDMPSQGRKVALVVGVNQVPDDLVSPLYHAESDAQAVAAKLTCPECGFHLHQPPLIGSYATTRNVKKALFSLVSELKGDDLLLFYFSGHGQPLTIEAERKDVYLVTSMNKKSDLRKIATFPSTGFTTNCCKKLALVRYLCCLIVAIQLLVRLPPISTLKN